MDTMNLRNTYPLLLSRMKEAGYSDDYIGRFRKEILWILSEAESSSWKCYEDIYRQYESILHNRGALEQKHAYIGAIEQFDLYGKYPDGKWNGFDERGSYPKLAPEFQKLVDHYTITARAHGKKESTIYMESHNAANFLYALQVKGFSRLDGITEDAVMSIFISPEGNRLQGHTYRKSATALLKACLSIESKACQRAMSFLPKTRSSRKNIQYLTTEETTRVRNALDSSSGALSLRDRAIGKLAVFTGLRSSDIAALELDSVDWENDRIRIRQQKTENPLDLPLTATVGNAIYDYLTTERPSVNDPAMFLTSIGSIKGLSKGNMWHVSERIMKAAGIRRSHGDRKGLHIFRHHMATTLLGNEISQVIISRTLGHSSPNSTESYLSADFVHLKSCALSISRFPVSEGVFGFE